MIYPNDHMPSHVHVWRAGESVIVNLGDAATRVGVRENNGMSARDERRALKIVGEHQELLLARWEEIHG